jgi:hypothetical protein
MYVQQTFDHSCGHSGTGPVLFYPPAVSQCHFIASPVLPTLHTATVPLPIACPFCTSKSDVSTKPGEGLLCILVTHAPETQIPMNWQPLHSCSLLAISPADWAAAFSHSTNERLQHVAWIPRPCGEVRILNGTGRDPHQQSRANGVYTRAGTSWREPMSVEESMKSVTGGSRMAGLLSQLRAALRYGELAGRYDSSSGTGARGPST